ncbi:oxidoreductase [Mycolicibacterium aromaticivorans JS19b1 = JCM 16368]|uniref:Oxidoreductase n=1 Tax=Mycolicibacterium aromaticivorans JS19b1 = JCM 16368 TaxID=1440774 RepID=A0A064CM81_9MYCO|nr:nitroreductase [Mycolicibacterium aromaticivorans]KDE99788.1 oxidoreductase [Mycolicibacterium aromaticivorans JS19b1 = JCM 16368]
MHDLENAIRDRRSIRLFLRDKPVPRELVTESLELAIRAPSNSNIQPWHVVFASGPARDRLAEALLEQADIAAPNVPELPEAFAHLRRELGALVYGTMGVARNDAEARRVAVLRNWEFFRAPLAGIVCMHRDLGHVDAVGVGMFLQTFLLALTARGLGSCVQVSVAGYPEVLREQLGIAEEMRILCGVSIGYPDPEFACNQLIVPRNPLEANVTFIES